MLSHKGARELHDLRLNGEGRKAGGPEPEGKRAHGNEVGASAKTGQKILDVLEKGLAPFCSDSLLQI